MEKLSENEYYFLHFILERELLPGGILFNFGV
jgi:hypothetical protein